MVKGVVQFTMIWPKVRLVLGFRCCSGFKMVLKKISTVRELGHFLSSLGQVDVP